MSHSIVFMPGIMGSELKLEDEVVWPPKALEVVLGYKRIDKLQRDDLSVGEIIRRVSCFGFYDLLLDYFDELGYTAGGNEKQLVARSYDWRLDLFALADELAGSLDAIDSDQISIVAHSMGGLVCRIVLESGKYDDRPWFKKIDLFTTLSTPHTGAPLALARTLGLDSAVGISAKDFKKLSSNPKYPSGYQLLPAPGEDAAWDVDEDGELKPLDIYDKATAKSLGLSFDLVERARAVHDCFAAGSPPDHVRYFYFAGTGHKTLSRVNVTRDVNGKAETLAKVIARASGDGTVPVWSSLPRPTQKHVVVQEHATVFKGASFKNVFFQLFGESIGPIEELGDEVTYSISQPVYHLDDPENQIEVVLTAQNGITAMNGEVIMEAIGENNLATGEARVVFPMAYSGPMLRTLTLDVDLPLRAGFYRLILRDMSGETARDVGEGIVFSVSN